MGAAGAGLRGTAASCVRRRHGTHRGVQRRRCGRDECLVAVHPTLATHSMWTSLIAGETVYHQCGRSTGRVENPMLRQ